MTKVTFETASLSSAVKKAARVAPLKGAARDISAGIIFEIDPMNLESPVIIKATNTDVWYMEVLDVIETDGDKITWRVSSNLLASIVGSLPVGTNKTVTLDDGVAGVQRGVTLTSDRTKVRLNTINPDNYPQWAPFDDSTLSKVSGLGGLLSRIHWAASRSGEVPYSGVHINGEYLIACDHFRFATMPCEIPLDAPITIPFQALAESIKEGAEVRIGTEGNMLHLMPDEATQIMARIYEPRYPDAMGLIRKHRDKPNHLIISKTELNDAIKRCEQMVNADRTPKMYVTIGHGLIQLFLADKTAGEIEEIIELQGQCDHDWCRMLFTPKNISEALDNCPGDQVTIGYDASKTMAPIHIAGDNGYEVITAPRRETGDTKE